MIICDEIFDEAKKIFGHCREPKLFRWITDSIELLANKGEVDPLVGYVDLCVDGNCVTLPPEIETPLAVTIGGHPALGRDVLFSFHLNGPGEFRTCVRWAWQDGGSFPTYRDLRCPGQLIAFLDSQEDDGKEVRVFGYDSQNRPLRTKVGDVWRDGILIPTIFGYAVPALTDPIVGRITAITKERTVANIRLSTFDSSSTTGLLLGIFEPNETKPIYRRIRLDRAGKSGWVRIFYRKRSLEVFSIYDRILLHSRPALIMAMRALKFYDDGDAANGMLYETNATRLLTEKESVIDTPMGSPVQVVDLNSISDKNDYVD